MTWFLFKVACLLLLAFALWAAVANAATRSSTLAQARADAAAQEWVYDDLTYWSTFYVPELPAGWVEYEGEKVWNDHVVRWELDSCEVVRRTLAECGFSYWWGSGADCDYVLEVRTTRRGRLSVESVGDSACEGDDVTELVERGGVGS